MQLGGSKDTIREALFKTLQEVWNAIGRELMDKLIKSIDTRVNAVLETKRWHIRF